MDALLKTEYAKPNEALLSVIRGRSWRDEQWNKEIKVCNKGIIQIRACVVWLWK